MKINIFRSTIVGIVMLGFAIPGGAIAGDGGKGCSLLGTWFGVASEEDTTLTGWMVTVTGKSEKRGTNNLEYPTFDPTLGGNFDSAVRLSSMRGTWKRTGGKTFVYTFTGIAVDANNLPVWIGKVAGNIRLSANCNFETITATLWPYLPTASPFDGSPLFPYPLPEHYGYRAPTVIQ